VYSIVALLNGGAEVEVATVGNEGLVGLQVALRSKTAPTQAFCQIPCAAIQLRAETFRRHFAHDGALQTLVLRYAQALFNLVAQSAACNRLHTIEERAA
jgi:hypothetical protein